MRLTTKGRQAVVAMIDVALHQRQGPVALAAISRRRSISMSYLEQMFADLRRHGLVESTRGPGGGYRIARTLAAVSVADIVFAVDRPETEAHRAADGHGAAAGGVRCLTPELWSSLSQRVVEFLDSVTLQKLVDDLPPGTVPADQLAAVNAPAVRRQPPTKPSAPNSVFQLASFQAR